MPDPRKFLVLRGVGYKVHRTCILCDHGDFGKVSFENPFGECKKHVYLHSKHNVMKGVSIVAMGSCKDIEITSPLGPPLGAHTDFLEKK